MLILNPETVKFGAALWLDVAAVLIDRSTERPALEWSDAGPHVVFADAPEQRITIRLTRRILRDAAFSPRPGDSAELVIYTAPGHTDNGRKRLRAVGVVMQVAHEISAQRGGLQTITLVAISSDGAADPVTIEDASDGAV